ncbi:MAG TPA: class I SAM-dependent methyltransferase [Steroidobacteraceae bacterium]|jgi:SAM-dependent methyltransferase|nr:class I SAM-dependent methyltransferase [Steroidobacteraceae bacterium]
MSSRASTSTAPAAAESAAAALLDTREAFDSVAADYDGPRGNNPLVQDMRQEMWRWLDASFPSASRLLELGCGTGIDAVRMAERGHRVTATDWSPLMVRRTEARAERAQLSERVETRALGAHELDRLEGGALYDGAYSNLGALNCLPDLRRVARECARLIRPGGRMIFAVIGRWCPWEIGYYARRRDWARIRVRFARGTVAVRMNGHTVWTNYWTPRELYRSFAAEFTLTHYRGLCVLVPPPYLTWMKDRHRQWHESLWRWDRRVCGWPLVRNMGDHFLIVMSRR